VVAWFLARDMRRLILFGTFVILCAAIYFLWQNRFERDPEFRTVHLADLRKNAARVPGVEWLGPDSQPTLRLRAEPGHHSAIVARMELPIRKPVDFLHLRFNATAKNLRIGKQVWADGRCIIEWHPGGSGWEHDPFCSVRHNQHQNVTSWVARPNSSPAIPALRLENVGASGDLELTGFEATVVRERNLWKIGRWFLLAGWFAWVVASIQTVAKGKLVSCAVASFAWVLMGTYFAIPGPWKSLRPLGGAFQIGTEAIGAPPVVTPETPPLSPPLVLPKSPPRPAAAPAVPVSPPPKVAPSVAEAPPKPVVLKSVGRIPDQGDFTLRLKHYAENARPLLHIALFFVPVLLTTCLIGKRPARTLGIVFALSVEAAQFAFGYGFDWVDVFDLACDATGIVLALVVYQRLQRFSPLVCQDASIGQGSPPLEQ
jgi:hypothetical protein